MTVKTSLMMAHTRPHVQLDTLSDKNALTLVSVIICQQNSHVYSNTTLVEPPPSGYTIGLKLENVFVLL